MRKCTPFGLWWLLASVFVCHPCVLIRDCTSRLHSSKESRSHVRNARRGLRTFKWLQHVKRSANVLPSKASPSGRWVENLSKNHQGILPHKAWGKRLRLKSTDEKNGSTSRNVRKTLTRECSPSKANSRKQTREGMPEGMSEQPVALIVCGLCPPNKSPGGTLNLPQPRQLNRDLGSTLELAAEGKGELNFWLVGLMCVKHEL